MVCCYQWLQCAEERQVYTLQCWGIEKTCDCLLEWFPLKCRKVIGFALTTLHDWLKNSRHFVIQSIVKPKPLVPLSHAFSLHVSYIKLLWVLIGSLYCPLWLARVITLVLVLRHSIQTALKLLRVKCRFSQLCLILKFTTSNGRSSSVVDLFNVCNQRL